MNMFDSFPKWAFTHSEVDSPHSTDGRIGAMGGKLYAEFPFFHDSNRVAPHQTEQTRTTVGAMGTESYDSNRIMRN